MTIGKMKKYREMLSIPGLRPHLPETHWATNSRILRMLKVHSSLFIKPNHGSGGSGIIRVRRLRRGYEVRCGSSRKVVGPSSVLRAIHSFRKPKHRYLVQKGLRLEKYHGTIFDIRVYLQKPKQTWMIAGVAARIAAPHKFVTNYHKGGHAESLQRVLLSLFQNNQAKVDAYHQKIKNISITVARTVNRSHPIHELGVDLAIDKNGRIWIIEANSHPGHMLFTQLSDHTMIRTIMHNKRLIGI
ncbi:endospore coat-associated protein YheC [Paenibacillus sp. CAA11]|uniref:YheC/YheD family protein n=1 Tax=Paenibacillus sp. CAA11 TaxID=1532905 RepID=UPI000D3CC33A|nr:YheC/YheD family protein [Paenibacillus sp. CAA11]AWB42961.1 endospore coat-associated protein YheC [Paenibacillus sp. CAA11]